MSLPPGAKGWSVVCDCGILLVLITCFFTVLDPGSQPKHMLWVLKRTISLSTHYTCLNKCNKNIIKFSRLEFFSLRPISYLNIIDDCG